MILSHGVMDHRRNNVPCWDNSGTGKAIHFAIINDGLGRVYRFLQPLIKQAFIKLSERLQWHQLIERNNGCVRCIISQNWWIQTTFAVYAKIKDIEKVGRFLQGAWSSIFSSFPPFQSVVFILHTFKEAKTTLHFTFKLKCKYQKSVESLAISTFISLKPTNSILRAIQNTNAP